MISFSPNKECKKLLADFKLWLNSNSPPIISGRRSLKEFVDKSKQWQSLLAGERWIGVHWPECYGGRGLTIVEEALIQEQLAAVGSPQLINLFGITMVGPVIIQHGTPSQKQRFLPKILNAEEIWCQGFSEPQAGSDLSMVHTRGVYDEAGDRWALSGQKIWTSFAQHADWCFLLARTNLEVPPHKGLSYFLVPMDTEGIEVRPLRQISGDDEFNEVFFEDVKVPSKNMVGQSGDGWKMAISTLMYERVILTFARHLQSEALLRDLKQLIDGADMSDAERKRARRTLGHLCARSMAVRSLALSHLITYRDGISPGPEGSLDKLGWSEVYQDICKFALEYLGPYGILESGAGGLTEGLFQQLYLYSRGRTIAAGTSEIQRCIIAERLLGLPRSR